MFRVLHMFDGDGNLCREHGGELRRRERLYADRYLSIWGLRWLEPEDLPSSRDVPRSRHMRSKHGDLQLPVGCQQLLMQRRQRLYSIRFLSRRHMCGDAHNLCGHYLPRCRNLFGWDLFTGLPGS